MFIAACPLLILGDHFCPTVPRIDAIINRRNRMHHNRLKAAARRGAGFALHVLISALPFCSFSLYIACPFVDRICRAPFNEPIVSFPKEYIEMLKGKVCFLDNA